MAIKLLIGGSPCTHWSISQKNNRETTADGIGWELFKNYIIAKKKFQPDFFLYENNKSAAQAIKDQIAYELGVGVDLKARLTYINSALVSAQNRQRFYVTNFGDIEQPIDRGILLSDILETYSKAFQDLSYALPTRCQADSFEKHQHMICAEPINGAFDEKTCEIKAQYYKSGIVNSIINGGFGASAISEPVRVGSLPKPNGELSTSRGMRIYGIDGKGVTLCGSSGGLGAKTGLYAIPVPFHGDKPLTAINYTDGKINVVYHVTNETIIIKGENYPIKLADGYYIIRKLTTNECCRLQTLPDDYCKAVSVTQAYKGLGNGWTAEVIIHLLNHAFKDIPKDEEIIALSMYDGIGTGRYCLDKMGFTNVEYHAYEIDKYAMKVANDNYPDIVQHGDAFSVREGNWMPPEFCKKHFTKTTNNG